MAATHATPSTLPRHPRVEGIVPERRLLGTVLLIVGAILAAGFFFPAFDQFTLASISFTLLGAFGLTREYGYAIPAGITGGLGTAILAITAGTFGPAMTPAVFLLSFAGGFLTVWVLGLLASPRVVHPWPLVPATILGSLGLAFAAGQPGAVSWVQVGVATVIVLAGVGLLRGHAEPRP
jgi:hypothetical protein